MDKRTALSKKARLLHLSALSLAEGMKNGAFHSLYKGDGIEFRGVREYLKGDDVRAIDWNVTARMGHPYVKVFEEDKELDVFIIIDTSRSMLSGSGTVTRLEKAMECASLLTLASYHNTSPVGAVLFDGKIRFSCPPKSGHEQVMFLLSQFEKDYKSEENGSALDNALLGAGRLLKKRTLVMVFSDFRTSGWLDSFARLCTKHDVVAVRIEDPSDEKLPAVGAIQFKDMESNYSCFLPTSSSSFQKEWAKANQLRVESWKYECMRHGGIPLAVNTQEDSLHELYNFFSKRERV
ncbi:MAG: DUF58 domain-containing protein [Treponema sp.]|nr:DUF58 domain-containing protein [Treponema sp.]